MPAMGIIGVVFLVLALVVVGVFVFVARSAKREEPFDALLSEAYALRKKFFLVLLASLVVYYLVSVSWMPYPPFREDLLRDGESVTVSVVGKMFYWEINATTLPVDTPVVFEVTSGDVNHGFGIYTSDGRLIAQTQAMPGYVNRLIHVFKEPGEYKIVCLEYCGFGHHAMVTSIKVVEK
jgi:cytochrome c oxidase subunit 2